MLKNFATQSVRGFATAKAPVRVAVTGAAGQIGYSLIPRIASGQLLGPDQPVILHLVDRAEAMKALEGVVFELQDCAFPLLQDIVVADDPMKGFEGVSHALLVGAKPRGPGMERGDLLQGNAAIFQVQGKALNAVADRDVKVVVVGNPANTNAMITSYNAPDLPRENFTALTRLDHDRALAQVALRVGCQTSEIENLCIWGNHSATQYPDVNHATVGGKSVPTLINNTEWIRNEFIPRVQKRGAEIIAARGASSAASAANATLNHQFSWVNGTGGKWVSMVIPSSGQYGVEDGIWTSYPVTCENGSYKVVEGLEIDSFSAEKIEKSIKELKEERDAVRQYLP